MFEKRVVSFVVFVAVASVVAYVCPQRDRQGIVLAEIAASSIQGDVAMLKSPSFFLLFSSTLRTLRPMSLPDDEPKDADGDDIESHG